MKIIRNKWIPFEGFSHMTLFWWIFTRYGTAYPSERTLNHERIHLCQIYGVWAMFVPLTLLLCATGVLSWWWLLWLPGAYYELYFLFWLIEVLLPPYNTAYKDNCFERESRFNAGDYDYCCFEHWFSWIKYFRWKR